jgi:hypothetical protein
MSTPVGVVYLKNRENHGRPQRTAPRISNRLVELAHIKRGNRVLDLATGTEIVKIFSRLQPLSLLLIAKITNRTH